MIYTTDKNLEIGAVQVSFAQNETSRHDYYTGISYTVVEINQSAKFGTSLTAQNAGIIVKTVQDGPVP